MRLTISANLALATLLLLITNNQYKISSARKIGNQNTPAIIQVHAEDGYTEAQTTIEDTTSNRLSPTISSDSATDSTDFNLNFDYINTQSNNAQSHNNNNGGSSSSQQNDGSISSSSVETTTSQSLIINTEEEDASELYSPGAGIRRTTYPSINTNKYNDNIKLGARHFGNRVVQSEFNDSTTRNINNNYNNYSSFNSNSINQFASNPRQSQSVIATLDQNSSTSNNNHNNGNQTSKFKRRKYNIVNTSTSGTLAPEIPTTTTSSKTTPSNVKLERRVGAGFIELGGFSSETSTINPTENPTTTYTSFSSSSSHYSSISPLFRRKQILLGNGLRLPRPTKYILNSDNNNRNTNTQLPITTFAISQEETFTTPQPTSSPNSPISITNRRVKIRLPAITTTPQTEVIVETPNNAAEIGQEQESVSSAPSEIEEEKVHKHYLPEPSPVPSPSASTTFEYNPSVTVQDGLYHYKYSVPEYSSRRIHTQQFGVTQHSYGNNDDDDDDGEEEEIEDDDNNYETTIDSLHDDDLNSTTPHLLPATSFEPNYYPGNNNIQRIENEPSYTSSIVNYQLTPIPPTEDHDSIGDEILYNHVKRNSEGAVTVTVTVTTTTMLHSSPPYETTEQIKDISHDHDIEATPALPFPTPASSTIHHDHHEDHHHLHSEEHEHPFVHGNDTILHSSNHHHQDNSGSHQNHEKVQIAPTPSISVAGVEQDPGTANSKNFKSVYYSSTENPYYKSSSYSYSSSQEYSFHAPNSNEHDEEHDGSSHHHSPHDHDHNYSNNGSENHSHNHQSIEEDTVHKQQQQIIPTTSTYSYWDTLGLKSVEVTEGQNSNHHQNNNHNSSDELPRPSPIPIPEHVPITSKSSPQPNSIPPSPSTFFSTSSSADLDTMYSTPLVNINKNPFSTTSQTSHSPRPTAISQLPSTSNQAGVSTSFTKSVVTTIATTTTNSGVGNTDKSGEVTTNYNSGIVGVSEENEVVPDDISNESNHADNPQQPHSNSDETSEQRDEDDELLDESGIADGPGNIPMLLQVPVFVKIALQDISPSMFCQNLDKFKEMITKIYEKSKKFITPAQIVVHKQPSCTNSTITNVSTERSSTTTRKTTNSISTTRVPYTTKKMKVYTGESSEEHQQAVQQGSRRKRSPSESEDEVRKLPETKFNISQVSPVSTSSTITTTHKSRTRKKKSSTLYVYLYMTDKNGTYDQSLTETFISIWNISRDGGTGGIGSVSGEEIGSGIIVGNMFSHKIKTVEMITSTTQGVMGHDTTSSENYGIIIGIAIASIVAVCLLVVGVFLLIMRHRQAKTKFAKRCTPVTLDDYSLDNISVFNSFRRKQRGRASRTSKRSYTNTGFEDPNAPSRPLNAAGLLNAVTTESAQMADEFSNIPNVSPTLEDIPAGAETKNRYANVIPVPDTRVLLTFQDEQQNSDYINANYVRGATGTTKAYIITQGPLDDTIVFFWRMVWEQQVRVILMLTDLSESGIPKCAAYYPRSETIDCSQLHGDFQVTLEKRDITENCIISYLVLKDMERSLRRDIIHCWYHTWPEKGVPSKPSSTIDFLMRTRKFTKESFPVVVHCSPGTGRSGTIVACDIGMKELDNQRQVDIPQIVKKIRQDRAGAVQTKEQYKHIYEVLNSYASKITNNASSTDNSRSDP